MRKGYYAGLRATLGGPMKAVILAGGLGTRMREETEFKPKPMVEIGGRPVIWHIMAGLSVHGINEFVILGGYKVDVIKNYFLGFNAHVNDFTLRGNNIEIHKFSEEPNFDNWVVTIVDTGVETLTAGRLIAAKQFIGGDAFICTYGDGLANVNIKQLIDSHKASKKIGTVTVFQPENRFGVIEIGPNSEVMSFKEKPRMTDWINIGFFVFEPEVWKYLGRNEPLEDMPLRKLADDGQMNANMHHGFWMPMDTYREYVQLSELWKNEEAPWKTW